MKEESTPESDTGVKRRRLLRFGTLITAFTGVSAISALGSNSAQAGPGDKNPPTSYVPIAEKGVASGVATLDLNATIPPVQLPDLSATYAPLAIGGKGVVRKDELIINAKDYGCTGNGTTDDSGAVGNARNAAGNGGTVYFPAGTYIMDGVQMSFLNQTWVLHDAAIFKVKNSSANSYAVKVTGNGSRIIGGVIDGNKANQTGGNMFQVNNCNDIRIEGVTFQNAYTYGLTLCGVKRADISKCYFTGSTNSAVNLGYSATNGSCDDILFTRNVINNLGGGNTSGGIGSYGDATIHNNRITFTNNRILVPKPTSSNSLGCIGSVNTDTTIVANNDLLGADICISIAGRSSRATVVCNTMSGFYDCGIEFAGTTTDSIASGNAIDSTGSNATGHCIALNNTASYNTITGNALYSNAGAAIQLQSGSVDTNISGNVIRQISAANGAIIANGGGDIAVTGNTINAVAGVKAALWLITSAGAIVFNGNKVRQVDTGMVVISSPSAITTDYITVVGNTGKNVPAAQTTDGTCATAGTHVTVSANTF